MHIKTIDLKLKNDYSYLFKGSDVKWTVLLSKICESMQCDAVKFANEALDHHLTYADMAIFIKNKFEGQHGGKWCCVVGFDADIGSTVSHKPDIYFHRGELGIVLFKTEVCKQLNPKI